MNKPLPTHLGGWQNIVFGKVEEGDLLIPNDGDLNGAAWAFGLVGKPIESEYVRNYFRVYRKLPVAKQGDLDHTTWLEVPDGGEPPTFHGPAFGAIPSDPAARKRIPIATGVLDYFPDALCEVAKASVAGNKQHVPGQPLHWDRSKSSDHADSLMRHFIDRGKVDSDGVRHSAKVVWRACAMLQEELDTERKK